MTTPVRATTQVAHPWRATVRTVFQFIIGLAVILPFIVEASGLDPEVYPWLGGILAVAAGVARVMALPQVEAFLRRFAPFLAADPSDAHGERGHVSLWTVVLGALALLVVVFLLSRIV